MTDSVAILMFLVRTLMIIGVIVLFIVFYNSAIKNVDFFSLQKTAGESANLIMESDLTDGRAIFVAEKLAILDDSDEELVNYCDKGIRYEFYLRNQSGLGENYTFGFMNTEEFRQITISRNSYKQDFNVWIKNGETLKPAVMRVLVFYNELTKFPCAAEQALVKVSVDSSISCPAFYTQIQDTRGLPYSQRSECVIYESDGKICSRITLNSLSQTPGDSGEFEICRKSEAIFAGRFINEGSIDEEFDFYQDVDIILRKQDLPDPDNKEVEVIVN